MSFSFLDLRYFPFDTQACKMTFGSWIYDMVGIDYYPYNSTNNAFGITNCIDNEGWKILGTKGIFLNIFGPITRRSY
jgi:hypothetical protein